MSELRAQDTPATSGHPPDVTADVFSHRYLAHATSQLPGRPASALAALARDSMSFGATRRADETLIKISDMDAATTAIDIVTADAPYLVDSVRAELGRLGHAVERVLHPQIVVTRDAGGRIVEILDIDDNAEVPAGTSTES